MGLPLVHDLHLQDREPTSSCQAGQKFNNAMAVTEYKSRSGVVVTKFSTREYSAVFRVEEI